MTSQLFPMILFGIATAFSPGPNNIMTSYTAFNFGVKKAIPTMLGVIIGWTLLIILLQLGSVSIFQKYQFIQLNPSLFRGDMIIRNAIYFVLPTCLLLLLYVFFALFDGAPFYFNKESGAVENITAVILALALLFTVSIFFQYRKKLSF